MLFPMLNANVVVVIAVSRKKFSQLARVFTGRKKRGARSILSEGQTPSKDNILLREDSDF